MFTLIPLVLLAGACGSTFGFFILGKYKAIFTLWDGETSIRVLAGIAWRGLVYPVGLLGVPMLLAGLVGYYPMTPVVVIALFVASLICSSIGAKVFLRRSTGAVRRLGLIGEEDL